MKRKLKEWFSIQLSENPGRVVLAVILMFNILFLFISAFVIRGLSLTGTEQMGFFEAAFCTVTMILDAGCISFVIADIGQSGVLTALICLGIIIVGMISFTGAVIGYITNYISSFIENSNSGSRELHLSDHVVILNWNTRASEIVNDLLYCPTRQKVVVLVGSRKAEIEREIEERLSDTVSRENREIMEQCKNMSALNRYLYFRRHKFTKKHVLVIVKEGDVFSSKHLHDISLEYAKTVIILGNDIKNSTCKYEVREAVENRGKGNSQTVKTLMQVSDITAATYSADDQKIIVEITDDWTWDLVQKIIKCKQVEQKCHIVPVRVNKILGQILSQFSLMPELNLAYKELFSNKGATFFTSRYDGEDDMEFVRSHLETHRYSLPLTLMSSDGKMHAYYSATSEKDIKRNDGIKSTDYTVKLNKNYWIENKNVIILGHNSKCADIMEGFNAFRGEWNYKDGEEILKIIVIDDPKNLEKMDYYRKYPFVIECVPANIYDKDLICETINRFIAMNEEDTSVLILSDDEATQEDIDANALANLVYVQDIINSKVEANPDFDVESIDVIVEIIDPKHHDIVNSYSVNNVVISNRYISKMISQIGAKEALFDFYTDILTYDEEGSDEYDSKEIYAKKVSRLFDELPEECTAEEFVRAVYNESIKDIEKKGNINPTIVLGYVKPGGNMVLFEGDQRDTTVKLGEKDKLIVFSNH